MLSQFYRDFTLFPPSLFITSCLFHTFIMTSILSNLSLLTHPHLCSTGHQLLTRQVAELIPRVSLHGSAGLNLVSQLLCYLPLAPSPTAVHPQGNYIFNS